MDTDWIQLKSPVRGDPRELLPFSNHRHLAIGSSMAQKLYSTSYLHLDISRVSGRARRTLLVWPTWSVLPKQRTPALEPHVNHSRSKQHFSEEAKKNSKQRIYVAAQELGLVVPEPMSQLTGDALSKLWADWAPSL